ncbi:MAG TPA: hypothetical protein VF578_21945 [Methylomirabilota bacterium]
MRDLTGGIEPPAGSEFPASQQQRLVRELSDLQLRSATQPMGSGQHGQDVERGQFAPVKARVTSRDHGEIHVAPLEALGQTSAPVLHEVDFHARVPPPIAREEAGEHRLDRLGRRAYPEHSGSAALQRPRPLAERFRIGEETPAPAEQIFALGGQLDPPADPVEEPHPQVRFEGMDLP